MLVGPSFFFSKKKMLDIRKNSEVEQIYKKLIYMKRKVINMLMSDGKHYLFESTAAN